MVMDKAKLHMKNPMIGRQSDPCMQWDKFVFIQERLNVFCLSISYNHLLQEVGDQGDGDDAQGE